MDVTESQLAEVLEGFYVHVRTATGTCTAQVTGADETAKAIFAALSRTAALREPHPTGPRLTDADLCARCGNQFLNGQVCDACRESHSYQLAEALKPDAPADPEVAAMAAIVAAMDRLDEETILLGDDVHERVIRWAMARWNVRD
jgi:hypothetical protein